MGLYRDSIELKVSQHRWYFGNYILVSVGVSPFMETTTSSGDAAVSEKNVGPASIKHRSYQQASHGL